MAVTRTSGGAAALISARSTTANTVGEYSYKEANPLEELFNGFTWGEYRIIPQKPFWATVEMWGAGATAHSGGGHHGGGAGGGHTSAEVYFEPTKTYVVWVGEGGKHQSTRTFGGGGAAHGSGATGGGLSGLFLGESASQSTALLIAGGAGGGGHGGNNHHGDSGGGGGSTGYGAHNVGGGSQTGGGHHGYNNAQPGSALSGGNPNTNHNHCGGGGGGWFGGGGGGHTGPNHYNGGGGGSGHHVAHAGTEGFGNYILKDYVRNPVTEAAPALGNGYQNHSPARSYDPRLALNGVSIISGRGNWSSTPGGDGRLIITPILTGGF